MKRTRTKLLAAGILLVALGNAVAQSLSTVQFASATYSVHENAGSVTLTVQRIGEPDGYAYVEYATQDGSATDGADYVAQNGSLAFFGGTNLSIIIPILNDAVAEPDKTFSVTLFNADAFFDELGEITTAIVTVRDNDRGGVEFSAAAYT